MLFTYSILDRGEPLECEWSFFIGSRCYGNDADEEKRFEEIRKVVPD